MHPLYESGAPRPPGKVPDLPSARRPMDLPRLVMRHALAVALGCLVLALALGLARVRKDTQQEMTGSLALARASEALAQLPGGDPARALDALRALDGLRHLRLQLLDAEGRTLLQLDDDGGSGALRQATPAVAALLGVAATPRSVAWPVPRPDGRAWTVVLTASPHSELREALSNFAGLFVLLAASSALMLLAMRWNVRRAFRPLQSLLHAIALVERHDLVAVRALPAMPIRELEAIAQALKHLAAEQERAESARRVLAHRLLSLQEDERQRLARDLHDEFGQRLTALRADASWLKRRLGEVPDLQGVATGMGQQVALIQDDVRRLLRRLRPLGPGEPDAPPQTFGRLRPMLEELVAGWAASAHGTGTRFALHLDGADAVALPAGLVLGVYRISQEALTNVARHAGARHARLEVRIAAPAHDRAVLEWAVHDDGGGLDAIDPALQRGSGLAGIKDRVWALGGDFDWASGADARLGGLTLRARLSLPALATPQAAA